MRALFWLRHPSPEDVPALDTVALLMRLGLAEFADGQAQISARGHSLLETEYDFFRRLDSPRR